MPSSTKVVVFSTGGRRVFAHDVVKKLEEIIEAGSSAGYKWELLTDDVTGIAKMLCYKIKGKKQELLKEVDVHIVEPLREERLFSQFTVQFAVEGIVTPLWLTKSIHEALDAFAKEFAKSFEGYERPSAFTGLATAE